MRPTGTWLALPLLAVAAGCGGTNVIDMTGDVDMAQPPPTVQPKFASLYGDYLGKCNGCHAPGSPGAGTMGIEMTLNFATAATAYTTLMGKATGLVGNQKDCNMVPFVVPMKPAQSLVLAVLDAPTRTAFDLASNPLCNRDEITDETAKLGAPPSAAFIAALKQWITDGAANN